MPNFGNNLLLSQFTEKLNLKTEGGLFIKFNISTCRAVPDIHVLSCDTRFVLETNPMDPTPWWP